MLASITMKRRLHALKARISGLTLVEIMVGLAVLGVLVAVAVPSMADLLERRRVIAAAEEVASVLNYAKAETNAINSLLVVRFDPDVSAVPKLSCVMVATSEGMNKCRCTNPANAVCPNTNQRSLRLFQLPRTHVKFQAAALTWAGAANTLRFTRDQSTIDSEYFRVDVEGLKKGYKLRVEVNQIGRVKVCSPNGDMTGYGACTPIPPPTGP